MADTHLRVSTKYDGTRQQYCRRLFTLAEWWSDVPGVATASASVTPIHYGASPTRHRTNRCRFGHCSCCYRRVVIYGYNRPLSHIPVVRVDFLSLRSLYVLLEPFGIPSRCAFVCSTNDDRSPCIHAQFNLSPCFSPGQLFLDVSHVTTVCNNGNDELGFDFNVACVL